MAVRESEASVERAGAEASWAAGGFGSSASGVGTLSDICLLTAAGAIGWMDGWMGKGTARGWGAGELERSATTSILPRTGIKNNSTLYLLKVMNHMINVALGISML